MKDQVSQPFSSFFASQIEPQVINPHPFQILLIILLYQKMMFDNAEGKFAKEVEEVEAAGNPWGRVDKETIQVDIFSETHADQLHKMISMSNALVVPLTWERDVCGFLELEKKDNGFAETQIAPNRQLWNHDLAIQHSSPSLEDSRPRDGIVDVSLVEQKMACEAQDSTDSQQGPKNDASPRLAPQQENAKDGKERKGMGKTKQITKTKEKPAPKAAQRRLPQMVDQSIEEAESPAPKTQKKDQRKNMYGYSFKHVIRELFSERYRRFLIKLCIKHGVSHPKDIISYYSEKLLWSISLSNVFSLLNYEVHPAHSAEFKIIKVFHNFYVWYMRKRYVIHILNSTEIEHKEEYIEATRSLIYMPRICQAKLNNLLVNHNEQ